jgi:hypothetical protein
MCGWNWVNASLRPWAEIHPALSQFSLLARFLIVQLLLRDRQSRVLYLVNLNSGASVTKITWGKSKFCFVKFQI